MQQPGQGDSAKADILVRSIPGALARHELTSSLAEEYGLELVYKEPFANILAQEQESRDFGGLLTKMGVLNHQGESAMDADQWEAASKSLPCRLKHA